MTVTELLRAEIDREAAITRRALAQVPEGHYDFKPHEKSMAFGYLAELTARILSWVGLIIKQDELDLNPPGGSNRPKPEPLRTGDQLVAELDKCVSQAREALASTNDQFLLTTNWRLLVGGKTVADQPRHVVIADTINHLVHHRGQLTVYLRLTGAKVPSIYGPTADEKWY